MGRWQKVAGMEQEQTISGKHGYATGAA